RRVPGWRKIAHASEERFGIEGRQADHRAADRERRYQPAIETVIVAKRHQVQAAIGRAQAQHTTRLVGASDDVAMADRQDLGTGRSTGGAQYKSEIACCGWATLRYGSRAVDAKPARR